MNILYSFFAALLLMGLSILEAKEIPWCYAPERLFVLFDAGETNALLPVMEALEKRDAGYTILPFGTSRGLIPDWAQARVILPESLGVTEALDAHWDRNQGLSFESQEKIGTQINPQIVITGVASCIQGECLKIFSKNPRTFLFAYRDNLNAGKGGYWSTAEKVQKCIPRSIKQRQAAVLFPAQVTADTFHKASYKRIVVGNPALEKLQEEVSAHKIRKLALEKLGLSTFQGRIITWIGGYDEPGQESYKNAFTLFVQCIKQLPKEQSFQVVISMHPKAKAQGSEIEAFAIQEDLQFMIPSSPLSTAEALAISNFVATYNSSLGCAATICNKQVGYVVPDEDVTFYTPREVVNGWASKISTPDQFRILLCETVRAQMIHDVPQIVGLPNNSVERLLEVLEVH